MLITHSQHRRQTHHALLRPCRRRGDSWRQRLQGHVRRHSRSRRRQVRTYEKELQRARDIALKELKERAQELGANAVVGVNLDYEVLGEKNGMLMVSASGTAVVVESDRP